MLLRIASLALLLAVHSFGFPQGALGQVLFQDNFGGGGSSAWQTYKPGWVEGGGIYHSDNRSFSPSPAVVKEGFSWTDIEVEGSVRIRSHVVDTAAGITLRFRAPGEPAFPDNNVACHCSLWNSFPFGPVKQLGLSCTRGGVFKNFAWKENTWYRLKATAKGSRLTCEVVGGPKLTLSNSVFEAPSSGTAGVRTYSPIRADFDDFVVRDLGGGGTPPPPVPPSPPAPTPEDTKTHVYIVHGIAQDRSDIQNLAKNLDRRLKNRKFEIHAGFDFGVCTTSSACGGGCDVRFGARELANYIAETSAPGSSIALVGYSLGGLIAREFLVSDPVQVASRRKIESLVTLGTPHLGYPHCELDYSDKWLDVLGLLLGRCPSLVRQMASDFGSSDGGELVLSTYLADLTRRWNAPGFAAKPASWLAVAGTFCDQPRRGKKTIAPKCKWRKGKKSRSLLDKEGQLSFAPVSPIKQRCPSGTKSARNDGVVCSDSALYRWPALGNKPSTQARAKNYRHAYGFLGQLPSCTTNNNSVLFNLREFDLFDPPSDGALMDLIVEELNAARSARWSKRGLEGADKGVIEIEEEEFYLASARDLHDTVRLLIERVESGAGLSVPSRGWLVDLGDAVAYTATLETVGELADLVESDPERFGYIVDRTLSRAVARGEHFAMARRLIESPGNTAAGLAARWVKEWLVRFGDTRHGFRALALDVRLASGSGKLGSPETGSALLLEQDPLVNEVYRDNAPAELRRALRSR